jgi:MFS family permease
VEPGEPGEPAAGRRPSPPRRRLLLDIAPIRRDPQFRRLWAGQLISVLGTQVTQIAMPVQVYLLTGSPLALTALTAVQLVPILILSPIAGSIVDAFDRRKVLLATQSSLAISNLGLIIVSVQEQPPIWAIYLLATVSASAASVDWPARTSSVPRLVAMERLPSAIALNQLSYNLASILGPAIGGFMLATIGAAGAYATDLFAFSVSIWALLSLNPIPPLRTGVTPGLTAIREGMAFITGHRVILSVFAIDLTAMVLSRPTGLVPILALDVFKGGPEAVGLLGAAPAFGAFFGALLSGWVSSVVRIGRAVIVAVLVWAITVTLFGLATFSFQLALVLLAIAGAADLLAAVLRGTIVQTETPDHLRGRVTSLYVMNASSGPKLGDMRSTIVASVLGAQASVVLGGLACIAGVVAVTRAFPQLGRHQLRLIAPRARTGSVPPPDRAAELGQPVGPEPT